MKQCNECGSLASPLTGHFSTFKRALCSYHLHLLLRDGFAPLPVADWNSRKAHLT